MLNNRLALAVLGVAAVLLLGLAGIIFAVAGGGDGDDEDVQANPTEQSSDPKPDDDDDEDARPAASGELRLRGDDPITLDPAITQDAGSAIYIVEIFSGLVRMDRNLELQPDVAESWEKSDDGTTYTFKLNRKATFHDGRPVLAEDIKYSWERTLNPRTGSVVAENFLGDIVGARDVARGRADEISGLKIVDDETIEVTIDAPKAYFLYKLTYPTAFVVDQRSIESNPQRWTLKPNGTGPYKLAEWKFGERIVLEAYDNHHLGTPTLARVRYELAGGSALVAYENGNLDITGIGLDDLERVQNPSNELNDEYVQTNTYSIDYIGFNTQSPPFDDPKVRQAFAMAVDRQKIAEVVLQDAIPVANGILMPGLLGHTPEDKTYAYDPERAKELLAESKYADDMPDVTLALSGAGATAGAYDEALVQFWKDNLGVNVDITQADAATFFSDIDQGRYQMFHLGWIMDYPDPEDILDVLFYSTSKQNSSRYSNEEIDGMLEEARVEPDPEQRAAMYQDIERRLVEDAAWIPMFFSTTHALVKPYVENFEFPPLIIERFRGVEVAR